PGLRAQARELGRLEADLVVATGARVGKALEQLPAVHARSIVRRKITAGARARLIGVPNCARPRSRRLGTPGSKPERRPVVVAPTRRLQHGAPRSRCPIARR